jgi:hypothetical protein
MPLQVGKNTPFEEQLAFFKAKLNLPTDRWNDIMRSAHDRAFVVAGAANADLLADLNAAVLRGIETGSGLEAFRKDFKEIVQKHGWTGWTGQGTAAGEAWRTRVIYQTNTATSYAAGRWQHLKNEQLLKVKPYWKYIHADGVAHPRPLHVSWHGLVLPHDHPFWTTHFPPNGWGCHCRVVAVDARAYAAAADAGMAAPPEGWQTINPKTGAPVGIDKSFDYAPGARAKEPLKNLIDDRLFRLAAPIGARLYQAMLPVLEAEQAAAYTGFIEGVLADPVARGRSAIAGAVEPKILDWLAGRGAVPASAEITLQDNLVAAGTQLGATEAYLSAGEWLTLRDALFDPVQVLLDTRSGRLVYILPAQEGQAGMLAVELEYHQVKQAGQANRVVAAYRIADDAIADGLRGGWFQKIQGA